MGYMKQKNLNSTIIDKHDGLYETKKSDFTIKSGIGSHF